MRETLDRLTGVALTLAAVAIGASLVHREFFAPANPNAKPSAYMGDWRSLVSPEKLVGDPKAPVTIVEFSDLQCPFCRRFQTVVEGLAKEYPGRVSYAFVHFPLPGHSQALPAAHATECAGAQGRFNEAVSFVFANQDSLGKRDWAWFAQGAGVRDLSEFRKCMADTTSPPAVKQGMATAQSLKLSATPTVVLNGWRYGKAPIDTEFTRAVKDLLAGKKPYSRFPRNAIVAQYRP